MTFHPVHLILILAALLVGAMLRAGHHSRRLKELSRTAAPRPETRTVAERIAELEREIARARDRGHA